MVIKNNIFQKKFFVLFSVMVFTLVMVLSPVSNAKAQAKEEEEINQLAKDLEFLLEEATYYDDNGTVIGFDFEALEARFGKMEEFEILKAEIENATSNDGSIQPMAKQTWKGCMIDALKDHFGVAALNAAINGGLWAYLEKKAFKEAAKLLLKLAIGGNIVGATSFLVWYSAKCAS